MTLCLLCNHVWMLRSYCTAAVVAAALGRTRAELLGYLSEHKVSYTFARDEFVPDPEAQVIKVSQASFIGTQWVQKRRRRRPGIGLIGAQCRKGRRDDTCQLLSFFPSRAATLIPSPHKKEAWKPRGISGVLIPIRKKQFSMVDMFWLAPATPCPRQHSRFPSYPPNTAVICLCKPPLSCTLVIACQELTRHASDKRRSPSCEVTGAPSRHASPDSPSGRREDERDSQKRPLPPLQAYQRYERGYLVSERRPP